MRPYGVTARAGGFPTGGAPGLARKPIRSTGRGAVCGDAGEVIVLDFDVAVAVGQLTGVALTAVFLLAPYSLVFDVAKKVWRRLRGAA